VFIMQYCFETNFFYLSIIKKMHLLNCFSIAMRCNTCIAIGIFNTAKCIFFKLIFSLYKLLQYSKCKLLFYEQYCNNTMFVYFLYLKTLEALLFEVQSKYFLVQHSYYLQFYFCICNLYIIIFRNAQYIQTLICTILVLIIAPLKPSIAPACKLIIKVALLHDTLLLCKTYFGNCPIYS